jgi:hypothetical protein
MHPKHNKTNLKKSNKTNRHKHKYKIKIISPALQTNIFHLNSLDLKLNSEYVQYFYSWFDGRTTMNIYSLSIML